MGDRVTHRSSPRSPAISKRDADVAVRARLGAAEGVLPPQAVGRVYAMGVIGSDGCVIAVEAQQTEEPGVWFNGASGSMARDAVENAAFAVRTLTPHEGGLRVNCLGGGQVDGPSIGLAAALAMYGALTGLSMREGLAVTGELALNGDVLPVGGVRQKLLAARRAGVTAALVPAANLGEAKRGPCAFVPVSTLREAVEHAYGAGGR